MKIIGITGTIGAGKGAVVEYLIEKNYVHYSARSFLLEELHRRNLEPIRDNFAFVANDLRKEFGPGYIIQSLVERARKYDRDVIIESVRTLGEIDVLRQSGGILLAVDADIKLRYERILGRGQTTDHVTFEKFVEDEERELDGQEAWEQNLKGCIKVADKVIYNNGSLENLYTEIETVIID